MNWVKMVEIVKRIGMAWRNRTQEAKLETEIERARLPVMSNFPSYISGNDDRERNGGGWGRDKSEHMWL